MDSLCGARQSESVRSVPCSGFVTRILLELLGVRMDTVRRDQIEHTVAAKLHQPSKAIRSVVTLSGQAYGEGRGEYVDIGLY